MIEVGTRLYDFIAKAVLAECLAWHFAFLEVV
jgi:hypothetical protein